MEGWIVALLNGVSYGLLLFMLSSGLTLIFSLMGVINFAHASFYMLGAYFAYAIGLGLDRAAGAVGVGFWVALFLAPVVVGLLGALVERAGLRRLRQRGHVAELLFTFALSWVVLELVQLVWGRGAVPLRLPAVLDQPLFILFGHAFPVYRAFVMAIAVLMMAALWLILRRTRLGLVVQAATSHPAMLSALGHDVPRVLTGVFAGGCLLAGLAGAVGGAGFVTDPGMALAVGPIVFVVTVIGGLGSLPGAFVASLAIGVVQTLAVGVDVSLAGLAASVGWQVSETPATGWLAWPMSRFAPILPYLLLTVVLVWRPRGLWGTRES